MCTSTWLTAVVVLACACQAITDKPDAAERLQLHSTSFKSPLHQIIWAGSPRPQDCDSHCEASCPPSTSASDVGLQQAEVCATDCGCGRRDTHLLLRTESGDGWASADGGSTWRGLRQLVATAGETSPNYRVEQIHVSRAAPSHVAVVTDGLSIWVSSDAGAHFEAAVLQHSGEKAKVTGWQWHPHLPNWALATAKMPGPPGHHLQRAFYTADVGRTFKFLADDVEQCHWFALRGPQEHRVLLLRKAAKAEQGGPASLEVVVSNNFMLSHDVVRGQSAGASDTSLWNVVQLRMHGDFLLAVARQQLWRLSAHGPLHFEPLRWPANAVPARPWQLQHISLLHAAGSSALIHVPTEDASLPWGHVFACSPGSADLELVLTDLQRPSGTVAGTSFQAVAGIDGIFIANRVLRDHGQDLDHMESRFDSQAEEVAQEREFDPGAVDEGEAAGVRETQQLAVRSYISVNMGLSWQPLLVQPSGLAGRTGRPSSCNSVAGACHLHLSHWVSCITAPGVLVGVGNLGVRLTQDEARQAVYVSHDAGLEWQHVLEGAHLVTFLAHGDLIAALPLRSPGTLLYSADSGGTWHRAEAVGVPPSPVPAPANRYAHGRGHGHGQGHENGHGNGRGSARDDENDPDKDEEAASRDLNIGLTAHAVYTHPLHTSSTALVALASDATGEQLLVRLDLSKSKVLERVCEAPRGQGRLPASADFEAWSPADALEDAHTSKRPVCMLGARTHYLRRKPRTPCQSKGVLTASAVQAKEDAACPCTISDWACGLGFQRSTYAAGAPCEPLHASAHPNATTLCAATTATHVQVTRGYVKSAGNRCKGGLDLSPQMEPCPQNMGVLGALRRTLPVPGHGSLGIAALVALLLLAWLHKRFRESRGSLCRSALPVCLASKMPAFVYGATRGARGKKGDDEDEEDEEREFLIEGKGSCGAAR